jgi:predicted nuclease with TOPRIM domain
MHTLETLMALSDAQATERQHAHYHPELEARAAISTALQEVLAERDEYRAMWKEATKKNRELVYTDNTQTVVNAEKRIAELEDELQTVNAEAVSWKNSWTAEANKVDALEAEVERLKARIAELKQANSDLAAAGIVPDGYEVVPIASGAAPKPNRKAFEAWAEPILGDNPTWKESADCELAWQAWNAAQKETDR